MKKTENFQLNQWESTDRILMDDFNNDNDKIDAALGKLSAASESQAVTLAQHAAAIPKLGNCRIYTTGYSGSGVAGANYPRSLTFPAQPVVLLIFGGGGWFLSLPESGVGLAFPGGSGPYTNTCSYSNGTFTWYSSMTSASTQMNVGGTYYRVVALIDAAV